MPARRVKFIENNHREHRSKKGRKPSYFYIKFNKIKLRKLKDKYHGTDKYIRDTYVE